MDESRATDSQYESPQPPTDATLRGYAELLEEYLRTRAGQGATAADSAAIAAAWRRISAEIS
jgi:hypothetical protein